MSDATLQEHSNRISNLEQNMSKLASSVETLITTTNSIQEEARESRIHQDQLVQTIRKDITSVQIRGGVTLKDVLIGVGAVIAGLSGVASLATLIVYGVLYMSDAQSKQHVNENNMQVVTPLHDVALINQTKLNILEHQVMELKENKYELERAQSDLEAFEKLMEARYGTQRSNSNGE